jgi:hypothetical protein
MSDKSRGDKDKNEFPMIGDECDCKPGECCPTDPSAPGRSYKGAKTVIFVVIMLAAVAVGAYSLIGDRSEADNSSITIVTDPALDLLIAGRIAFANGLLGDDDFAYLTLKGAGAALDQNKRVELLVEDAAELIRKKGTAVRTSSAVPGDEAFSRAVDLFGVTGLPAVLAMSKKGGSVLLESDFTENNLLKAYLMACDPATCAPGCDPKDCGS